jgi:hypothetical protein
MPTAATHHQRGADEMQGRHESTEYSTHPKKYEDIYSEEPFTRNNDDSVSLCGSSVEGDDDQFDQFLDWLDDPQTKITNPNASFDSETYDCWLKNQCEDHKDSQHYFMCDTDDEDDTKYDQFLEWLEDRSIPKPQFCNRLDQISYGYWIEHLWVQRNKRETTTHETVQTFLSGCTSCAPCWEPRTFNNYHSIMMQNKFTIRTLTGITNKINKNERTRHLFYGHLNLKGHLLIGRQVFNHIFGTIDIEPKRNVIKWISKLELACLFVSAQ